MPIRVSFRCVKRVLFRAAYGALLVAIFVAGAWLSFRRSIVGRSVTVPDLTGKSIREAMDATAERGLTVEPHPGRARYDDRVPRDRILLQDPAPGALAKPAQTIRVVLSLSPAPVQGAIVVRGRASSPHGIERTVEATVARSDGVGSPGFRVLAWREVR